MNTLNKNILKISVGAGKMLGLASLNTNSLSNNFCKNNSKNKKLVCSKCYSNRLLSYRITSKQCFEKNSLILAKTNNFDIPKLNFKYFRLNSFGELINKKHLLNICKIAENNKKTIFGLWTKRKDLINRNVKYIPKNVILIYSNPVLNSVIKIPKNFHKVFNVVNKNFDKKINCKKQCITCLKCYKFSKLEENNIIIEQVK